MAMRMLPSVPFLKPTGHDRPEASSRWTCDSVVRAPIAPQAIRSAVYCGVIVSRNSVAQGSPRSLISRSRPRARRSAFVDAEAVVEARVVDQPFHPTVVRGFSKYTRITIRRSFSKRAASFCSRVAYSMAESTSWIEQGPTTDQQAVVGTMQDTVDVLARVVGRQRSAYTRPETRGKRGPVGPVP
jgi:hypothetical protein